VIVGSDAQQRIVLLQPCRIERRGLARVLELLEIPTADQIEPLIAPDYPAAEIVRQFRQYVLETLKPDLLLARSVTAAFHAALQAGFQRRVLPVGQPQRGWMLELPATTDQLCAGYSANFRSQLRRKLRKAEAAEIVVRHVSAEHMPEGYDLGQAFETLTHLHRRRFATLQRRSFFLRPEFQRFHRTLCASGDEGACNVVFTEALRGDRVIGSMYGVRSRDTYLFLMVGFDPEFGYLSPGTILLYRTIEEMIRLGVARFDLKCGDEPYKQRWATHAYDKSDLDLICSWRGDLMDSVRWASGAVRALFQPLTRARSSLRSIRPEPGTSSVGIAVSALERRVVVPAAATGSLELE
jgi:CelD/BcsL family acetyltransferase involved in cellulose biosynthesis